MANLLNNYLNGFNLNSKGQCHVNLVDSKNNLQCFYLRFPPNRLDTDIGIIYVATHMYVQCINKMLY